MAIILGIDPGSRVTGYGVIDCVGSQQRYLASGCIRTDPASQLPGKLKEIFQGIGEIIDEFDPVEAAVEKIFMAKSPESALKLGHARGAAILAGVTREVPIFEYEARKVKQAVVGTGAASKSQIQHMVMSLLKLNGRPQADAADALAIAICHINTQHQLAKLGDANQFRRGRLVRLDS